MLSVRIQPKTFMHALAALVVFTAIAAAQIPGLCNTGQTHATATGCTDVLVPTALSQFGTPFLDGNWEIGFPWPNTLRPGNSPCLQEGFVPATVPPANSNWLPNSVSTASEWTMPPGGQNIVPQGYYIYRTNFPVPPVLPGGGVPTGVTVSGQLASDNATYWIYLESPAHSSAGCSIVSGQQFPVNPVGGATFSQWWPFTFKNSLPLTPGADAYLYIIVGNGVSIYNSSASGLRVEFFPTSAFN